MKNIFVQLFITFFKIGAFTFGGGWAMISIIEKEIVDKHRWLRRDEFLDLLAVAQALPGILAVNISVAVGDRLRGTRGSVCSALGTILPSFMIILAIAIFLTPDLIKNNPVISSIFKGIRPAVVALIVAPVISSAKAAGITWRSAVIPVAVALLIWSKLPVVSNPILYIVLGGACGYWWWTRRRGSSAAGKGVRHDDISQADVVVSEDRPFRIWRRLCDACADRARDSGFGMDHSADVYRHSGHIADDSRAYRHQFGHLHRLCGACGYRSGPVGAAVGSARIGAVHACRGLSVVYAGGLYESFYRPAQGELT